ncbi:MAG: endonuclease/exonuclease/phosphatase family protein [Kofleriaceae bacterium]|nr:endonuclease/exonuclease/phosphatase family protein [Kofleriaceae bacterium]
MARPARRRRPRRRPSGPDAHAGADAATAAPVTVVTLNLRCLIDDWDARLPLIADGLIAAAPDVIALQEVCAAPGGRDALEELVAALVARGAGDPAVTRTTTHLAWDTYDEGLAILAFHPIAAVRVEPLTGGALPRKLLAARIAGPAGALVLGATHLDHQSDAARAAQAAAVAAALDGFAGDAPTLLLGDLNEAPGGGVTSTLEAAGFTDGWRAVHPDDPGATFPSVAPDARIDYVWLRGAAATTATRILVPTGDVAASDHLGVRVTIAAP